ncbi:MAG: hypothetical protein ACFE9Z_08270 [Promethearchaeota archaeon]
MKLLKVGDQGELIKINRLNFEDNDVYLVDDEEKNTIFIWVGNEVEQSKKDTTADIARRLDKEHGGSAKILIMKQKREYGSFLAMMHDLEKGLIPGKTVERRPEFVFKTPPESIKSIGLDGIPQKREVTVEERVTQWLHQLIAHRGSTPKERLEQPIEAIKFIKFQQPTVKKEVKPEKKVEPIAEPETFEEETERLDLNTYIREAAYYLSLKGYNYDELCWLLAERILKINMEMPSIEDIKRKAEQVFKSSCTYDELCWLNAEMDILIQKKFLEKKRRKKNY